MIAPLDRLAAALDARAEMLDARHESALRLLSFYEGVPDLAVDLYARTLVLHDYADPPGVEAALAYLRSRLPWVQAAVVKARHAPDPAGQRGELIDGPPDRRVSENGVWYALDLLKSRDAGFYLDTRNLRAWARAHLAGKTVLNTFAYTGSLGVAAQSGGAAGVVHLDQSRAFLNVAKTSYTLNGFPIRKADFITGDFWAVTSRLRRENKTFDCVFLDPPFFAAGPRSTVDLAHSEQLINKVRPLVADGGWLVAVNNALFVSGADYMAALERLAADGYLAVEELIPVPLDTTGFPSTRTGSPPVDPAPFNHPTKIAVLRVRRKA